MDLLTRESLEHGQVFESIAFFKKSFTLLSSQDPEFVSKIRKFFADYIVAHFKYEESKVFLPILKQCTLDEKRFIRSLQAEHIAILGQVDEFDAKLAADNKKINIAEVKLLAKAIISATQKHTHKEDVKLFPLMEKYITAN